MEKLAKLAGIRLEPQEFTDLILAMDERLKRCAATKEELDATDGEMAAMDLPDLKRMRAACNSEVKDANDARKEFKRKWQAPLKAVEDAFNEELAPLPALAARYAAQIAKREDAMRQERYELLCEWYSQIAPILAPLVPIERFGIERGKISTAKGWSAVKAEQELEAKCQQAAADYDALLNADLAFRDECEGVFFRTLSLTEALNHDAARKTEQERIELLRAELGMAQEAPEEPAEAAPEPQEAPEAPTVPERMESPAGKAYTLRATMTPKQLFGLKGYLKAAGIEYEIEG